ncbi:MAG: hypothetical protein WA004_14490 [Saprospiraceae bacterium]
MSMELYLKQIQEQFRYRPIWPPGKPLEVGVIGKIPRGIFTNYTTIEKELGVKPEIQSTYKKDDVLEFETSGSVQTTFKAKGQGTPPNAQYLGEADAGVVIEFNSGDAVVFKLKGYHTHQIMNLAEIQEAVVAKYKAKKWDKEYVLITEVIEADGATILISKNAGAKVELAANADIGGKELNIADASLGWDLKSERSMATKVIAQSSITPLYLAMSVRKSWFGPAELEVKRSLKPEGADWDVGVLPFDPDELDKE